MQVGAAGAAKAQVNGDSEGPRRTTIRVPLLQAYGFWTFGRIALWAAITSLVLAAFMGMLVALGFWHSRRGAEQVPR